MAKTYADLTVANATAGNAILASDFTTLFTNSNGYRVPPMVKCTRSSDLTGYTSNTMITWNGTDTYDTDSMHDPAVNGTRITFNTAGIYRVTFSAYMTWTTSAMTIAHWYIYGTGSATLASYYSSASHAVGDAIFQVTALVDSASYSYVEAAIAFTGGSAQAIKAEARSFFAAEWIGQKS